MRDATVLTIGYGSARSLQEFIALLGRHGVEYVIDVRTRPYSKFRPEFSKDAIASNFERAGLAYTYMGDSLGGMPSDESCYTDDKVDYAKVRARDWFQRGAERIERGWREGHRLALMCAELEPHRCHRSKLIGEELDHRGISVEHIDEHGAVVSHADVIRRITRGQGTLFDIGLSSRRKYAASGKVREHTI